MGLYPLLANLVLTTITTAIITARKTLTTRKMPTDSFEICFQRVPIYVGAYMISTLLLLLMVTALTPINDCSFLSSIPTL